mgnify:CR=1 FL=1
MLVRGEQDLKSAVLDLTGGRGVDIVLDHVAGPGFTANLELLAPLGRARARRMFGGHGLYVDDLFVAIVDAVTNPAPLIAPHS